MRTHPGGHAPAVTASSPRDSAPGPPRRRADGRRPPVRPAQHGDDQHDQSHAQDPRGKDEESVQQVTENGRRELGVVRTVGQHALLVQHEASFHDHQQRHAHRQLEHGPPPVHRQPQAEGDQRDRDQGQHQGQPVEGLHPAPYGGQVARPDEPDLAEAGGQRDSQCLGQLGHRLLRDFGAGDSRQGHVLAGQLEDQSRRFLEGLVDDRDRVEDDVTARRGNGRACAGRATPPPAAGA